MIGIFSLVALFSYSHNLKQITNRDGLSNSSVICLFQDSERFLWVGTYDGLNMYDGRDIYVYKPHVNSQKSLSSNVIREIIETKDQCLWVNTKWGLNKLSRKKNSIEESYDEFRDSYFIAKDSKDHLFVLGKQGFISFYDEVNKRFIDISVGEDITNLYAHNFTIDDNDTIWITLQGKVRKFTVDFKNEKTPRIVRHPGLTHSAEIINFCYNGGRFAFVDLKRDLYTVNRGKAEYIANISELVNQNGIISTIIFDDDDILIGFKTNGLFRLIAKEGYRSEKIDINCGVFSLWKDELQNIIWIGTDGQGVFAYTKDAYTFCNITLNQLPIKKKRPVRAIQTDKDENLWLGTKDNGVICIKNYRMAKEYSSSNVIQYTMQDGLANNSVFAFSLSRKNILWICSDGPGISYYSYDDQKIHRISDARYVHTIYEASDSVLWVGADKGLLKLSVEWKGNKPIVKDSKAFLSEVRGKRFDIQIYSMYAENDSILWLGTRGSGAFRFNMYTGSYQNIRFNKVGIPPIDDILCILKDSKQRLWFGSSYGLTRLDSYQKDSVSFTSYSENKGLPNNTIHGMKEDSRGNLWLSSNTGIIQFNPDSEVFRQYNYKTGLDVFEFSDNAYYQSPFTGSIFFGGINGVVWLQEDSITENKMVPEIYFTRLRIFNEDYNINDLMKGEGENRYLELKHNQNFFSISFVAMDFINGANSSYPYLLENFSNVWMNTEQTNEAHFTSIPPGKYVLKVRYNSGTDGSKDQYESITIVILPPWYFSIYAKIGYFLLIIGIGFYVFRWIGQRNERKRKIIAEKLEERHKEEVYEEKLRFFTNITHEFCTPLTLIYGPCERILTHPNTDSFTRKYVRLIKSNTERLNALIQEVIEFRRMETGHKTCNIQQVNINEVLNDLSVSFSELAEQNKVTFEMEVDKSIYWNTDFRCLSKILNNLISNAFKYTPEGGIIRIRVLTENSHLLLRVYNTGKGIREENRELIFNRYSILDNIEENAVKGLSSRNGLGMAICHSMVELLKGEIHIESEVDKYAEFIVSLPELELTPLTDGKQISSVSSHQPDKAEMSETTENETIPVPLVSSEQLPNDMKAKILVIDDNKEILGLVQEILSDKYRIVTADDGEKGMAILKAEMPDLVITDIMMPGTDGFELTRQIKQNKHTMYIPLIILSAKNTNEEKIEGIEAGADAYIPKPFNATYLCAVVDRLLDNRNKLKEYYNSSASAYEFTNGQLMQKEDKDFMQNVIAFINENMDNAELSPEDMASYLQLSIRNLYRKFKELDQLPPKDFIKDYRVHHAAKLLKTTKLTIQEIIYKSGFNNRSHFYKEFDKRFNTTPREFREAHNHKDETLS